MSRASFSLLPSMNMAVFQFDLTTPSWVQPEVPEVMPKVWLPVLMFVMPPNTCGARPRCPSNSSLPQPQLPMLFSPAAIAPRGNSPTNATATSFFFNIKDLLAIIHVVDVQPRLFIGRLPVPVK